MDTTLSCHIQQLTNACFSRTVRNNKLWRRTLLMCVSEPPKFERREMPQAPHKEFAKRLHQAWDYAGFPQGRHRTTHVADHYEVSRESARKWSLGLSRPAIERLNTMAVQTKVNFDWLSTGRGSMEISNSVRETPTKYDSAEELRLVGLVRKLPRKKQRALIQLLEET